MPKVKVEFALSSAKIEPRFGDNARNLALLKQICADLRSSNRQVEAIYLLGSASPEGDFGLNVGLSRMRLAALERLIRNEISLPDSIFIRNESYIPWDELLQMLDSSDINNKDEVRAIVSQPENLVPYSNGKLIDDKILKLQRLNGGKTWKQLSAQFFAKMRSACAVAVLYKEQPAEPVVVPQPQPTPEPEPVVEPEPEVVEPEEPIIDTCHKSWYLKTNIAGWALLIQNIGVERDLSNHFSVALPIYYSCLDYFKHTIKFHTLAFQPELRYWFRSHCNNGNGLFVALHAGLAWYNLAVDGPVRYQDHKAHTPAYGGGINIGYRCNLSRSGRWRLEVDAGAGIYPLNYDKFVNDYNGPYLEKSHKKTYIGLDRFSLSIVYTLNLNKKGAKR
jgi:hypothetical protein